MSGASNRNYTKDPNRRKTGLQIGDTNSKQLGKQRTEVKMHWHRKSWRAVMQTTRHSKQQRPCSQRGWDELFKVLKGNRMNPEFSVRWGGEGDCWPCASLLCDANGSSLGWQTWYQMEIQICKKWLFTRNENVPIATSFSFVFPSLSPSLFLILLMDCIVPKTKSATIFEDWCL